MKIWVGFSTTNRLHSRIIRWFTDSPVSHCYIRLNDEYLGLQMILHADWPGVVFLDANVFDSDNIAIVEFEFDDPRLGKSLRKHLRFLGRKYDGWKLWNWAWTIMLRRWIKQKLETPIEDPKKIICVDFIIRILNDAGITNLSLGAFTPAEFLDWLNKNHAEKKKETTEHPKKTS